MTAVTTVAFSSSIVTLKRQGSLVEHSLQHY